METVSIKVESDLTLKQDAIEAAHELKSSRKQLSEGNKPGIIWRVWLKFPTKLIAIGLSRS